MSEPSLETLIRVFNRMRDKRDQFEAEVKNLEKKMQTVKTAINDAMRESDLESVKTAAGLAYRTVKTTYSVADWTLMHGFVLEHQMPELLEKRLHQGNVKKYLEEHPDDALPGLNSSMEYSITIKRGKND